MAEIETAEDLIKGLFAILFLTIFFFFGFREIWRTHFASDRCRESFCSKKAQKDSKYCRSCRNQKTRQEKYNNRKSFSNSGNITKKENEILYINPMYSTNGTNKSIRVTVTNNGKTWRYDCETCGKEVVLPKPFSKTIIGHCSSCHGEGEDL